MSPPEERERNRSTRAVRPPLEPKPSHPLLYLPLPRDGIRGRTRPNVSPCNFPTHRRVLGRARILRWTHSPLRTVALRRGRSEGRRLPPQGGGCPERESLIDERVCVDGSQARLHLLLEYL